MKPRYIKFWGTFFDSVLFFIFFSTVWIWLPIFISVSTSWKWGCTFYVGYLEIIKIFQQKIKNRKKAKIESNLYIYIYIYIYFYWTWSMWVYIFIHPYKLKTVMHLGFFYLGYWGWPVELEEKFLQHFQESSQMFW